MESDWGKQREKNCGQIKKKKKKKEWTEGADRRWKKKRKQRGSTSDDNFHMSESTALPSSISLSMQ